MPFLAPLVPILAGIGGAATGGALSGTAAAIAGGATLAGTGAKIAGSVIGSGGKTPTYTPQVKSDQDRLLEVLQGMLDPSTDKTLAPVKSAAIDTINRNYANLPNKVTAQAAARGFGSSGKVGGGLLGVESSRLGDLSGLEGTMAQLGSQRQLTAAQIMQRIIESNKGTPDQSTAAGLLSGGSSLLSLLDPSAGGGSSGGGLLQQILKQIKVKGAGGSASNPGSGVDPALLGESETAYSPLSALTTLHTMLNLGGSAPAFSGSGWGA